jgi:hypothetical protein
MKNFSFLEAGLHGTVGHVLENFAENTVSVTSCVQINVPRRGTK